MSKWNVGDKVIVTKTGTRAEVIEVYPNSFCRVKYFSGVSNTMKDAELAVPATKK